MDRCAVFVDAGYVFAGGVRLLNQPGRAQIRCHCDRLAYDLRVRAEMQSGMPMLRVYWYDAAVNAVADAEQEVVAHLPRVKLRLGRLVNGRQKGVDALIIRDLMTLARERAMAIAFLVTGDEDLREGVVAIQDMGVQLVLVGFPNQPGHGQAETLINEADEHLIFEANWWQNYFEVR